MSPDIPFLHTLSEARLINPDISLANGSAGIALYQIEAGAEQDARGSLSKTLATPSSSPSLFFGNAGTLWVLRSFLERFPDPKWSTLLELRYLKFKAQIRPFLSLPGHADLIRGTVGIGILAMKMNDQGFLSEIILGLKKNAPEFYRLDDTSFVCTLDGKISSRTDFGLAHGIAGVLAFLSLVPRDHDTVAKPLAEEIFRIFENIYDEKKMIPNFTDGPTSWHQGWCYGNIGVAHALTLAGRKWNTPAFLSLAENLADDGISELQKTNPVLPDGLCHGISSLSLMLKKMDRENPSKLKVQALGTIGLLEGEIGVRLARAAEERPSVTGWENLFLLGAM